MSAQCLWLEHCYLHQLYPRSHSHLHSEKARTRSTAPCLSLSSNNGPKNSQPRFPIICLRPFTRPSLKQLPAGRGYESLPRRPVKRKEQPPRKHGQRIAVAARCKYRDHGPGQIPATGSQRLRTEHEIRGPTLAFGCRCRGGLGPELFMLMCTLT